MGARFIACGFIALQLIAIPAVAQDLGHRFVGSAGLNAGRQPDPGLYVSDRLAYYRATTLRDRGGNVVPTEGLDLDAFANAFGVLMSFDVPSTPLISSVAAAVPLASVRIRSERPESSLDRRGLGDVYLQPVQLGIRSGRVEAMAAYELYLPTGLFRL